MANYQTTENAVIALGATAKYATVASGVKKVYLATDTNCYIAFDENVPTTSTGFFLHANDHPADFDFSESNGPLKIWGIGTSGNLYILIIR